MAPAADAGDVEEETPQDMEGEDVVAEAINDLDAAERTGRLSIAKEAHRRKKAEEDARKAKEAAEKEAREVARMERAAAFKAEKLAAIQAKKDAAFPLRKYAVRA